MCIQQVTLSVMVTGANRGIGLGLVRQLVLSPSVSIVIATARNVESATDLQAIGSTKLRIVQLEVVDEQSIARAAANVALIVGDNGLDFLINNAGIILPEKVDGNLAKAAVMEQLEVNSVAPLLIATKFHSILKKAADMKGKAQIVNISSFLGSIERAPQFSATAIVPTTIYSISKAALNMLTRKLAIEWKKENIRSTAFCPGWVKTDMGTDAATLTLEESTGSLVKHILALTEGNNGLYYRYNGKPLPW